MLIHKIYNYICHSNKHVTKAEQIIYHTLFFKYSTFKFTHTHVGFYVFWGRSIYSRDDFVLYAYQNSAHTLFK